MTTTEMTLNEIRDKGCEALVRELGPIGYARFMQQFTAGAGDYTAERHQWVDNLDLKQIKKMVNEQQRTGD